MNWPAISLVWFAGVTPEYMEKLPFSACENTLGHEKRHKHREFCQKPPS